MKYTKDTKEYITSIEKHLLEKYGDVKDEWKPLINLIADNYEMYRLCLKSIETNGIYNSDTGKKNPLLSTCKDLQATIIKQIQHLGLSPYAVNKINTLEDDKDADLLKSIMGND